MRKNHTYEIAEKSPQQHFEGNMIMSAVITLWGLLTKFQTITFITNSSDELPGLPTMTHQLLTVGVDKYAITFPEFWEKYHTNPCLEFLLHSRSNRKTQSWCWIPLKKQSIVSSFKLQQACEDKLHFILACPCASKHLRLRHREAYLCQKACQSALHT